LAEHVRVAPHQLGGETFDHISKVECALLLRHPGMENDLKQEIAEFITQVVEITSRDGVGDFICLLDGIGGDRLECLLQVPGAPRAGRAQRRHDLEQPRNIARRGHDGDAEPQPSVADRSAWRLASNRNQQRFSASSMNTSRKLAVATSLCSSARSWAARICWI